MRGGVKDRMELIWSNVVPSIQGTVGPVQWSRVGSLGRVYVIFVDNVDFTIYCLL